MRRPWLLLIVLLLGAALLAACAPAAGPAPLAVSGLPTPLAAEAAGRAAQPAIIPSLTPLGPAANSSAYGSVQLNAQGVIVPTVSAGGSSPLLFSAQAVDPGTPPANVTPAATVIVVSVPTPLPGTTGGTIAVPPIGDSTGGVVVSVINTLCIPVINFLLTITVGLVQAIWNAVGTQTNAVGQVGLCVLLPGGALWYFLLRRRRRRR